MSDKMSMKEEVKALEQEAKSDYVLGKLWDAYSSTDDRRRKAFYFLYSGLAILALLSISAEETLELPFVQTEVERDVAVALIPSFILILIGRYLYLSAHSLISYVRYLDYLTICYGNELRVITSSWFEVHSLLKARDITEIFNCFLFPIPIRPSGWATEVPKWIIYVINLIVNLGQLISIIVPVGAYLVSVMYFAYEVSINRATHSVILAFYIMMGVLLILSPVYFYYRTGRTREIQRAYSSNKANLKDA